MRRHPLVAAIIVAAGPVVLAAAPASAAHSVTQAAVTNVDVSQRPGNESEGTTAVNPTNPNNVVIITNIQHGGGLFEGVSFDGGVTWTTSIIGDNDNLGVACCDPTISFDEHGNLFLSYLYLQGNTVPNIVPVALSTDGGLHFNLISNIVKPDPTSALITSDRRGLFRFVDQPTITAASGAVWLVFNAGGPVVATGAAVTGLGAVGSFIPVEAVPGTNNCTYGDVAIAPGGQVMQVCTQTESGQGGGHIRVSEDADGLGPGGFGGTVTVTDTHVGGFDFIPAQPDRSVDAEPGLAWDRSGGPHRGRVYLVYAHEHPNESDDTDIMLSYSDDQGVTWSAPLRVNDDRTVTSQFLPKISLDQTDGHVAIVWYDARNDLGLGGAGDTDGVPNDDAQFWGAFSDDGTTVSSNLQISAGTSNSHDSQNSIDYGDYSGLSFFGGVAHPAWSDNSNSTGNNPDGQLHALDIYSASVTDPT